MEAEYKELTSETCLAYVRRHGMLKNPETIEEVTDGNLNRVFIVRGKDGDASMCVKQSLPYIRVVPSAPLHRERILFEHAYLLYMRNIAPEWLPEPHFLDKAQFVMGMDEIMNMQVVDIGLSNGETFGDLGRNMGKYLAKTMYHTSDFYLPTQTKRQVMAYFEGNAPMCDITEDVWFSAPFKHSKRFPNQPSPGLLNLVEAIQHDRTLNREVDCLKRMFKVKKEALLHGDLHAGSIMANEESLRVIDPEFATVGPFGFDMGCLLASLCMAYFRSVIQIARAKHGLDKQGDAAQAKWLNQRKWLVNAIKALWTTFATNFEGEIYQADSPESQAPEEKSDEATEPFDGTWPSTLPRFPILSRETVVPPSSDESSIQHGAAFDSFMREILHDSIGMAGVELIRRSIGVAKCRIQTTIPDEKSVELAQYMNIMLGRLCIVYRDNIQDIATFVEAMTQVACFALHHNIRGVLAVPPGISSLRPPTTIFLLAKYPKLGRAKTRLAATYGDQWTSTFATACILDLLQNLANFEPPNEEVNRIIVYAPPDDETKKDFETLMEKYLPVDVASKWSLQPVHVDKENALSHNLGSKLSSAMRDDITYTLSPSFFFGMDTITFGAQDWHRALAIAHSGRACMFPAMDGGYTGLVTPALARSHVFDDVSWSSAYTFASQMTALQRENIQVEIGPPKREVHVSLYPRLSDIDVDDDVEYLIAKCMPFLEKNYKRCHEVLEALAKQ